MVEAGHQVVLFDNLSNSKPDVVQRLEKITGKNIPFVEGDVRDTKLLEKTLRDFKVDAVIHFAGLKAVTESVRNPIEYYANNVQGSISLLEAMKFCNIKTIVFSSSATVYGEPQYLPLDERHPTNAVNPYGRTKLQVEEILNDLCQSDHEWSVAVLRYFNPVGAHHSGIIGEEPVGLPDNLMPYLAKVALGDLPVLKIYGDDYSTPDGTGVRDYIHVDDLVSGHLAALGFLEINNGWHVFNLGTSKGFSVLELIDKFSNVVGRKINKEIVSRRAGDVASCFASALKAKEALSWEPKKTIEQMCFSSWKWVCKRHSKESSS